MKQCHTVACFVSFLYLTPSIDQFLATVCICRISQKGNFHDFEGLWLLSKIVEEKVKTWKTMKLCSFATGPWEQTFSNLMLDADYTNTRDFLFFSFLSFYFESKWMFNPQKGRFWSFWLTLALARYSWRVGKCKVGHFFFRFGSLNSLRNLFQK